MTLSSAAQGNAIETIRQIDSTGLDNLAKHAQHLVENIDSALSTLDALRSYHQTISSISLTATSAYHAVGPALYHLRFHETLAYQHRLFTSTKLRLTSLSSRIDKIIQLSLHLVAQADSRTMQSESQSMKTIAVMTLFFMPLSTIASVFGSEFFNTDEEHGGIVVSRDIWWLWAVTGPLTMVVLGIWRFWYWNARKKLIGTTPGVGGGHIFDYMKRVETWVKGWRDNNGGKKISGAGGMELSSVTAC